MPIINKIQVSDTNYDINDSRIAGVDIDPTQDSSNVVTSGGVYETISKSEEVTSAALNDLNNRIKTYNNITNISYSELAELKNKSKLIPGRQYRITDYVTMTKSSTIFRSVGHQFDIIVTALSSNKLDEEAKAIKHEEDVYFANTKFDAWKIWYCLDNDTSRFSWLNSSCKGAIYRMIDEWDNDVPYDFKNIQFLRYKVTAKAAYPQLSILDGFYIGLTSRSDRTEYSKGLTNNTSDGKWYYTFSWLGNTWADDVTDASLDGVGAWGNIFCRHNDRQEARILNNIVCANGPIIKTFCQTYCPTQTYEFYDTVSVNNILELKTGYLSLFGANAYIKAKGPYRYSTLIGINRHNSFGSDFENNTTICCNDCAFNTIAEGFYDNVIVSYKSILSNTLRNTSHDNVLINTGDSSISYNFFGGSIANNTIYGNVYGCNITGAFVANTIGTNQTQGRLNYVIAQGYVRDNFINNLSNCSISNQTRYCNLYSPMVSCNISGIVDYLNIPSVINKTFYGIDIVGPIRGSEEVPVVLDASQFYVLSPTEANYRRIKIEKNNNDLIATWQDTNGLEGIRKVYGEDNWVSWINTANIPVITEQPNDGMLPNKVYDFGTISENTTFVLNANNTNENIVNCYRWTFNISDTVPTIIWPSEINYWYPNAPTIDARKYYDISLNNGVATVLEILL